MQKLRKLNSTKRGFILNYHFFVRNIPWDKFSKESFCWFMKRFRQCFIEHISLCRTDRTNGVAFQRKKKPWTYINCIPSGLSRSASWTEIKRQKRITSDASREINLFLTFRSLKQAKVALNPRQATEFATKDSNYIC